MKKYPERSPEASASREARIVELSRLGVTVKEICADVGVGHFTVVAARRAAGVQRYSVKPFTPDEEECAESLLKDGCSYAEVARTTGRHRQVLSRKFPGYAWTVEQRTEHTNTLLAAGLTEGSKVTQEGMWREKKRAQAERLKREAAELEEEGQATAADEVAGPEINADLEAELRELNRARTTGADRIVAYCDACEENDHNPVLGVYRMTEEAEEQSEQHRIFSAKQGHFEHNPYEYDLFERPLHANPGHILPLLKKHFWRSDIEVSL